MGGEQVILPRVRRGGVLRARRCRPHHGERAPRRRNGDLRQLVRQDRDVDGADLKRHGSTSAVRVTPAPVTSTAGATARTSKSIENVTWARSPWRRSVGDGRRRGWEPHHVESCLPARIAVPMARTTRFQSTRRARYCAPSSVGAEPSYAHTSTVTASLCCASPGNVRTCAFRPTVSVPQPALAGSPGAITTRFAVPGP